jgi:hypothetical protein
MGFIASLLSHLLTRWLDLDDMKAYWLSLSAHLSVALIFFLLVPAPTVTGRVLISLGTFILYNILVQLERRRLWQVDGKYSLFLSCCSFLAIFTIFMVIFYPGGMITDSHYLFSMAYADKFQSYRSRFLALVYQFLFLFQKSTVPILVAQLFMYAAAIALLIRQLLKKSLLAPAILIFCLALLPMFSGLAGVLCENTWVALCYLFGMALLATAVQDNPVRRFLLAPGWLFLGLGFFARSYDILYGLPLFFVFFCIVFRLTSSRHLFLPAFVLTCLMLVLQVGSARLIDSLKATVDPGQHEKFMNYYRALPVPFDHDIRLPAPTRAAIEEHLKSKGEGWRALNDLAKYSILVEGKEISREEVVPELFAYIRSKPYIFLQAYWARFVHLLVIPYTSNWVTSTKFHPEHQLNKLDYQETETILEKWYVHYANNYHKKYAYIYQPVAIFFLSVTALLLAIIHFNRSSLLSLLLVGWAGSAFVQVLFNLMLAYHGAYRLYYWSVLSSILIITLIHARQGRASEYISKKED